MAYQPRPVTTPKSAVGLLLCVLVAGCSVDHSSMAIEAKGIQTMLLRERATGCLWLYSAATKPESVAPVLTPDGKHAGCSTASGPQPTKESGQ